MAGDVPEGQPFSRVYLRTELLPDSRKFRVRLAGYVDKLNASSGRQQPIMYLHQVAEGLRREGGIAMTVAGRSYNPLLHYSNCPIDEVLDTVTVIYGLLKDTGYQRFWLEDMRRLFAEEALRYRVDDRCGVHPLVDAAFQQQQMSVLQGLGAPRYNAARVYVDQGIDALQGRPADTRGAVKYVFDSAEALFKLMTGTNVDLTTKAVEVELKPVVSRHHTAADTSQQSAAQRMLEGFKDWVNASHVYRHAQGDTEPHAPEYDYAVAHVGAGLNFVRWLAAIDAKEQKKAAP